MSKLFKKSLAVMTTAAILASTASVVSYAAYGVTITWDDANITSVSNNGTAITTGNTASVDIGTLTIEVAKGYKPVVTSAGTELTVSGSGTTYTCDASSIVSGGSATITTVEVSGGSEPTPEGKENSDRVVWVNGKDVKANTKVTPNTPAQLYKTEQVQVTGTYAGGKWQVAVTDATIDNTEAFVKMFDEKGKFDSTAAKEMKKKASAKIKEGNITVTAGKEAAEVNVWVYEVNKKSIVSPTIEGAKAKTIDIEGIEPMLVDTFTVKVAPTMAVTTAPTTVDAEKNTIKAVTEPKKLDTAGYDAGSDVLVYFGDKKNDASLDATYVLWDSKNKVKLELTEGKYVGKKFTAELVESDGTAGPAVKISIGSDAVYGDKIEVSVKNVESGKIAKIAPKVKKVAAVEAADEVTVTFDATVTVKNGDAAVTTGDKIKKDVTLTITPADASHIVSINGTAQAAAGEVTYKVTGLETDAKLAIAAAAPVAG